MNGELTTQTIEAMTADEMAQALRDFSREALAALHQRQEAAADCAPFDEELVTHRAESADIETENQGVIERLTAAERMLRFENDRLIVLGKTSTAESAKLAALVEQLTAEAARIAERKREISARIAQIELEKATALRNCAVDFRDAGVALIRAEESALSDTLDAVRAILNDCETRLGVPIYSVDDLTAGEKTASWITLNRCYRGSSRQR